jgi:hypothetical protein
MTGKQHINSEMKYSAALQTALTFTADRLGVDLEDADERTRLWELLSDTSTPEAVDFCRLLAGGMQMEDSIESCFV